MQVATTIYQQLGGNRFSLMTGAKDILSDGNALQFKLPARFANQGINFVRIKLERNDTYTMEFYKFRGLDLKAIETREMVYADELRAVFTAVTGLDCSL